MNRRALPSPPHAPDELTKLDAEYVSRAFGMVKASEAGQLLVKYLQLRLHRTRHTCCQALPEYVLRAQQGKAAELHDLLAAFESGRID